MRIINFANFFREVKAEGDRIAWPTLKETLIASSLVFAAVFVASLFFLMIDGVIYKAINYILTVGG
ncbi:preprotein translocase subunit SecE [Candidatus Bandiella euplotis]|uniref:preprotein translocase subunit SecE n=1 Tax=Candidatus Bandiella euplotis TaxID=1664265 RepID=UPI0038995DAF